MLPKAVEPNTLPFVAPGATKGFDAGVVLPFVANGFDAGVVLPLVVKGFDAGVVLAAPKLKFIVGFASSGAFAGVAGVADIVAAGALGLDAKLNENFGASPAGVVVVPKADVEVGAPAGVVVAPNADVGGGPAGVVVTPNADVGGAPAGVVVKFPNIEVAFGWPAGVVLPKADVAAAPPNAEGAPNIDFGSPAGVVVAPKTDFGSPAGVVVGPKADVFGSPAGVVVGAPHLNALVLAGVDATLNAEVAFGGSPAGVVLNALPPNMEVGFGVIDVSMLLSFGGVVVAPKTVAAGQIGRAHV